MHLTIFIKTMKSLEMIMPHSFYPLHLKSVFKLNIITSQGSGFSLMNPTLAPPAPPGGGILLSAGTVHHRAAADCGLYRCPPESGVEVAKIFYH